MQRWADELSKHPIHTVLKQFEEQLARDVEIADPVNAIEKARFTKVVMLMRRVLADLDPDLAPFDLLNQLQNSLSSHGVVNTITAFSQSSDPSLFQQANTQITPSLSYIYQMSNLKFARSTRRADIDAASKVFAEFSEATRREFNKVAATTVEGMAKIAAASAEMAVLQQSAKQIEQAISSKLAALEMSSTETTNSQKTEFSAAQLKRQEEFSASLTAIRNEAEREFAELFEENEKDVGLKKDRLDEEISAMLNDARQKHRSILDLYGLSARDSVSGGHKGIADREYSSAQSWRWLTIGAIVAAAGWVGYSLFFLLPVLEPERLFWVQIGKSIALTGLLISFAVYASKQANLHRLNERKARSFSLQIQAFDPFIAALPDDLQHRLKEELTKRIFGREDFAEDSRIVSGSDFRSTDSTTLLNQLAASLVVKK